MHLCTHCWNLSYASMSPFYSISGKFYLLFPWPPGLPPSCFPLLHFQSRHPFSRALFSSAQVLLWCWTVFTERRHPEWQSNKSWESNSEMTGREIQRGCTSFLPSFLQPCQIFVSPLFSPHLVKMIHSGRFMALIKVKDWALHTASEVYFILIFNSCSFHIGDLPRRLSSNRFFEFHSLSQLLTSALSPLSFAEPFPPLSPGITSKFLPVYVVLPHILLPACCLTELTAQWCSQTNSAKTATQITASCTGYTHTSCLHFKQSTMEYCGRRRYCSLMKWIYVHRSSMTPCMLGWYLLMFSGCS